MKQWRKLGRSRMEWPELHVPHLCSRISDCARPAPYLIDLETGASIHSRKSSIVLCHLFDCKIDDSASNRLPKAIHRHWQDTSLDSGIIWLQREQYSSSCPLRPAMIYRPYSSIPRFWCSSLKRTSDENHPTSMNNV